MAVYHNLEGKKKEVIVFSFFLFNNFVLNIIQSLALMCLTYLNFHLLASFPIDDKFALRCRRSRRNALENRSDPFGINFSPTDSMQPCFQ